jgi:hypothetical protein
MHVIGTGVIPACRDTNHSTEQDRPAPVARIDGVDPGLAVATYPDGAVYVNALTSGVINKVLKSARGIRWRELQLTGVPGREGPAAPPRYSASRLSTTSGGDLWRCRRIPRLSSRSTPTRR